ncbi:MAG: hypothetical protein ABW186_14865, partial [Rhodanobacteraceae bacterium]
NAPSMRKRTLAHWQEPLTVSVIAHSLREVRDQSNLADGCAIAMERQRAAAQRSPASPFVDHRHHIGRDDEQGRRETEYRRKENAV